MSEMEREATLGFTFLLCDITKLESYVRSLVLLPTENLKQVLSHANLSELYLCCAGPRVGSGEKEAERVTHPWGLHQP